MDTFEELMKKIDSTPTHFRMDGTPYEGTRMEIIRAWGRDFEKTENRTLARTYVWWGAEISTVWLGLNHRFGFGPPLIFETMVFWPRRMGSSADMDRYSTKEEALAGHKVMHRKWSNPFYALYQFIKSQLPSRWQ